MSPRALALFLLLATLPAGGAVHVWTGASSDRFSDAGNWRGGSPAGDPAAELSFPAGATRLSITNDLPSLTIKTLAFSGTGYVIGGNAITLTANAGVNDTTDGPNVIAADLQLAGGVTFLTQSIFVSVPDGVTVSGSIGGSGPLVKIGAGRLTFTGSRPNTYSGETRVLDGELRLGKANGVNAVPGDVVVDTTGVNNEYGSMETLTSEQIPDTARLRVGQFARFAAAAVETIGPIEVEGAASIGTYHGYSGNSSGTIILAGDIDVFGDSSNDVRFFGDFALSGIRTVTTHGFTGIDLSDVRERTPGSGLIIRGASAFGDVDVSDATYYGPTIIESGYARITDPNTPARLRGGTLTGSVASLIAESGVIDATASTEGLKVAGGLRLSGATKVRLGLSATPKITAGGTVDLRRAMLELVPDGNFTFARGATHVILANNGPGPILGTFFDIPEGHVLLNRFRISYKGGDGNDVTLTNVGRLFTTTRVDADRRQIASGETLRLTATVSASVAVNAGNVTFRSGEQVVGTAAVNASGTASITFQPPRGTHRYTATYEGTADLAPSLAEINVMVTSAPAQVTSVTPDTVPSGTTVDAVIRGSGFVPGGRVELSGVDALTPMSVTATEVRFRWNVPRYEEDRSIAVGYEQPDGVDSNRVPIVVKAAPTPKTKLVFEPQAITGPVVPGGGAAWLAVGIRQRGGALVFEHRIAVTPDSDRDGIARWEQTQDVAPSGLWLMTDMSDGTILSGTRTGSAPLPDEFPEAMFLRDPNGNYSHVVFSRLTDSATDLLWVRPGTGAWYLSIEDGDHNDLDGSFNAMTVFDVSQMQPVDGSPAPPAGVQRGDVFLGLDYAFFFGSFEIAWFGDRVDDHLRESDGPGTLRLVGPSLQPVQESAGTVVMRVLRTGGSDGTISVDYRTEDDTAKAGTHYVGRAGTLAFGPGEILKTIEIPLIDNAAYSGEAAFNVVLSSPAARLRIRIRDNDPAPQLTAANVSVTEGDDGERAVQFPVTLSAPASVPVTARWGWGNELGTLTFVPGGPLTQIITVRYDANRVPEENRTIGVRVFEISNALPDRIDRVVTIVDDDFSEITVLDATVDEAKSSVNVIVAISSGTHKRATVDYTTASGSATAGEDFAARSGTLDFDRTFSREQVTIPITADTNAEGDEWFTLVLSEVKNATLRRTAATIVIVDDDAAAPPMPSISVAPAFVTECCSNTATFRLRLSSPARTEVRVRAATVAGTATADADFTPVNATFVIPKDAGEVYVGAKVLNDFVVEGQETFSLALSEPVGATIATPAATATIFDDDEVRQDPAAATVTVSGTTVTEGNAGVVPARFNVTLSRALTSPVTVPFATADAGAIAPADYVPVFGTLTFAPGETSKTVEVMVHGDREFEADETLTLVLGTATNAWTTTHAAIARIVNDDEETPGHRRSVRH